GRVLYPNVVGPDEARQLLKAPADIVTLVLARPLMPARDRVTNGEGMAFSGGFASADGNQPLVVKRVFEERSRQCHRTQCNATDGKRCCHHENGQSRPQRLSDENHVIA
ncbi:unnamed protein product, partial [Sphagnum balticum]